MTPKGNLNGARRWLARLNEQLSVAARRLFQSQLVLRAASEADVRAQLPELCALASSVCEAASSSKERKAIRRAFSDPQAQWLSRSAVESGASGFFCHLLLREAATRDSTSDDARRLVLQVLLDPVLRNCYERAVQSGDAGSCQACEWRFKKPKYYAMPCAGIWEVLLPFLVRAARQHATLFGEVLDEAAQQPRPSISRVNCRFTQVGGFWRLIDALCDPKSHDNSVDVRWLVPRILAFAVNWSVLCEKEQDEAVDYETVVDTHSRFHDMLMDKFFLDLQEFLFRSPNATSLAKEAFMNVFYECLNPIMSLSQVQQLRFCGFTAVACLLVKGLGLDIGSAVMERHPEHLILHSDRRFYMLVGIASHIFSTGLPAVLALIHAILDQYVEDAVSVETKREVLMWAVYVIVCRQEDLDARKISDNNLFTSLQERICTIPLEDLQMMPLHWMEVIWKSCIGMDEDSIQAFLDEARIRRATLAMHSRDDMSGLVDWERLIHRVPFRRLDQYPSLISTLGDLFNRSLQLVNPSQVQQNGDVAETITRQLVKKKRRLRCNVVLLSEEHEGSRQSALLMPEVMERICSYMSAKRLARLSLVCKAFALVVQQDKLWRPLYMKLTQPLAVKCRHGSTYKHYWRAMFQAKYVAMKKLRNRQLVAVRRAQRERNVSFCWFEDDHELRMSVTMKSALLCQECGCNHLSLTSDAAKNHRTLHEKYRCHNNRCRTSFTSAKALEQHQKNFHRTEIMEKRRERDDSYRTPGHEKDYHCSVSGLLLLTMKATCNIFVSKITTPKQPTILGRGVHGFWQPDGYLVGALLTMDYKFTDDTSTAEVVWAAAERIGKTDNAQDISRICEYLINKHWFQSAGDLRAAKENRPEWHALEIPGRLKIAIQDILDSSLDMPTSGNLVLPSTEVTNNLLSQPTDEGTANTAAETCTGIGTNANPETSVVYNGVGESHAHPSFGSHDPNYHYSSAEAEYAQDAAQQAAYAAAWDAYYAAIAYNAESEKNAVEYSTEYPTTLQSDYSTSVVEAHEVVVEDALVVEVEPFEPEVPVFSSDVVESSYGSEGACTSWNCGQCTFMNTFDVAFCEVCCGHISLSLDAQSTSNPGEPTNDHQLKGNFTSQSDDIGEAELIEKRADLVPGTAARSIPFSDVDPALVLPLPATHCGTIPTRPYVLEPPLFVSIPSPTKPMAPIYNPTAPDLDLEEDVAHSGDNRLNDHDLAHLKISPAVNTEESTLPKIDYCALAFNRIPAGSSTNATETVVSGHRTAEFI